MKAKIPFIATPSGITAVINGEQYTITSDNPSYKQVLDAIKQGEDPAVIVDLFNTANAIGRYLNKSSLSKGDIVVDVQHGELLYKGEVIHGHVVDRILDFIAQGLPSDPLINFLNRLMQNPSKRAIEELYRFAEHKGLPITDDGKLLAYKGVNEDYTDCHTGKFDNRPGKSHEMKRNLVDDDARQACSNGFHVGSLEYATGFGRRTVIVEVDPADVVSVPFDSNNQKMRVCKYRVVCDYKGALNNTIAKATDPYDAYELDEDDDDEYY